MPRGCCRGVAGAGGCTGGATGSGGVGSMGVFARRLPSYSLALPWYRLCRYYPYLLVPPQERGGSGLVSRNRCSGRQEPWVRRFNLRRLSNLPSRSSRARLGFTGLILQAFVNRIMLDIFPFGLGVFAGGVSLRPKDLHVALIRRWARRQNIGQCEDARVPESSSVFISADRPKKSPRCCAWPFRRWLPRLGPGPLTASGGCIDDNGVIFFQQAFDGLKKRLLIISSMVRRGPRGKYRVQCAFDLIAWVQWQICLAAAAEPGRELQVCGESPFRAYFTDEKALAATGAR